MSQIKVTLPPLHTAQLTVMKDPARFRTLVAGRRFGKTRLGVTICMKRAMEGGAVWWVAPTYKLTAVGWRLAKRMAVQIPGAYINNTDRMIEFASGGWVQIRSADDPESLRSEGLDLVVIDEAAYVRREAWEAIRPAVSDRLGKVLFISTPRGRNWFWEMYQRGFDDNYADWASYQYTSGVNPFMPEGELDTARLELPERIFKREYLAEFDDEESAVFRRLLECATAPLNPPHDLHEGHQLILGVDWGKMDDYTVLALGCQTCAQMLEIDRFNQIDYRFQVKRLEAMLERWGARDTALVYPERNSIGEPIIESLIEAGLDVRPFTTTATSKPPLIESLALAFEKGEISILNERQLLEELRSFTITINPRTSRATYSAPSGIHDDMVIATALMWHGMTSGGLLVA